MSTLPKTFPRIVDFVRVVALRFDEDRCMQIASSLTYTTLLSLVPLVTVALTLISAFPVFKEMSGALERFVFDNMLPESAGVIAGYAGQFRANAARLTVVGIAFLAVTAIMLLMTIDRAFNQIWRVSHPRPVVQRVLIYWTLLTIGPILIGASLSLTSWVVSLSLGLVKDIPGAGLALLKTAPVVLTALALALLYLTMPNRRVALRDAMIGGVLAGIAFEAMKRGFAFYVTQFPTYKLVYGAFASVPIFLVWVYLSWLVVLFGAVVVATLPDWRKHAGESPRVPGSDFLDALRILQILWRAHQKGEVVQLPYLHGAVGARYERIEALLDAMVGANWVSRVSTGGWILSRDPHLIRVEEVYRHFVFRPDARGPATEENPEVAALMRDISVRIAKDLQMSLEELFKGAGTN